MGTMSKLMENLGIRKMIWRDDNEKGRVKGGFGEGRGGGTKKPQVEMQNTFVICMHFHIS